MKLWQIAALACSLLLMLAACGERGEILAESSFPSEKMPSSASESSEQSAPSAPPQATPESESASEEPSESLPTEAEVLASVRGLPENFDPERTDHLLEYFVYLLGTGDVTPLDPEQISYRQGSPLLPLLVLQRLYTTEPYLNEVDVQVLDTAKQGDDGAYLLSVNVLDGKAYFRTGKQTWYVQIGYPPFGDMGMTVLQLMDAEKAASKREVLAAYGGGDDVQKILAMQSIAFIGTFSSPKDLDPADRTGYMIVNVPPTGTFDSEHQFTYISQQDMDTWSEKLFGVRPHVDPESRFYDSVSYQGGPEKVYSQYYGWGPPIVWPSFICRTEDSEGTHYYFEEFDHAQNWDQTHTIPTRLLRYTMRDGMVWSCVDVSEDIPPSFYLDEMLPHIPGAQPTGSK